MTKDEFENIALESTRTTEIDEFVKREEIDPRYIIRPYYLIPDGKVGHDAFAVIRETIRSMDMVAVGRVVLTSCERALRRVRKRRTVRHPGLLPPGTTRARSAHLLFIVPSLIGQARSRPHPRATRQPISPARHVRLQ